MADRFNEAIQRDLDTAWERGQAHEPYAYACALFFYDSVKSITLDLPAGWAIEGVKGNTLKNIKPETIINIGKEYAGK